jgi:microcystin-dependent protein
MIDFPPNPAVDDVFTVGGASWVWDGIKWVAVASDYYLPLAGGQLTGDLLLAADPTAPMAATTKGYTDTEIATEVSTAIAGVIGVPIGGVIVFAGGGALPPNFLLCNGGVYNIVDAPLLAGVVGAGYGGDGVTTFAVPNLLDRVPVGAGNSWGITAVGGEINHVLDANELTYHDHGIYDPTHIHGVGDPSHDHYFNDPWHAHPMGDPGHAHGGVVISGGTFSLGNPGWTTQPGNTGAAGTGVYTSAAPTNAWNSGAVTGLYLGYSGTGVQTYAAGGSWAHNNMQPFVAMNYIIRYA